MTIALRILGVLTQIVVSAALVAVATWALLTPSGVLP